jgi:hypothetical protein
MQILSIDGRATAGLPPAPANDWKRLAGLHAAIDADLATNGAVRIGWRDAGGTEYEASIAGVPACPTRFELLDGGSGRASADGTRVLIGRKFAGMGYAEDELAAALAHEFAHNLLAHRKWLRAEGRNRKTVRLTEDEADRLMPWLLANAGYDPAAAVRFFERWGPGNDGGLFRNRNHSGWDERAEAVTAEIARLVPLRDAQGSADWRTHFVRTAVR